MKVHVRVEGLAQLAAALRDFSTRLSRSILRQALIEAAEPMRADASSFAPRAPGSPDLADNIVISNARPSDGSVGIAMGPAVAFFYGYFQEFGTSRHGAQAFLRPSFDGGAQRAINIMKAEAWHAVISRGGSRGGGGGGLL